MIYDTQTKDRLHDVFIRHGFGQQAGFALDVILEAFGQYIGDGYKPRITADQARHARIVGKQAKRALGLLNRVKLRPKELDIVFNIIRKELNEWLWDAGNSLAHFFGITISEIEQAKNLGSAELLLQTPGVERLMTVPEYQQHMEAYAHQMPVMTREIGCKSDFREMLGIENIDPFDPSCCQSREQQIGLLRLYQEAFRPDHPQLAPKPPHRVENGPSYDFFYDLAFVYEHVTGKKCRRTSTDFVAYANDILNVLDLSDAMKAGYLALQWDLGRIQAYRKRAWPNQPDC